MGSKGDLMHRSALLGSIILAASLVAPLGSQNLGSPADPRQGISKARVTGFQGPCATPSPDRASMAAIEKMLSGASRTPPNPGAKRIPVAVHLITSGREGAFSKNVVNLQIRDMNAAFAATPFSFYLT